ncbi:S8 family peptidase [Actinomadura kijaniata]|uniref:S8 family peptidase n=1 Tax=Actinomadura kijaniata TaxID=46161 RepID=UPI003F1CE10B
MSVTPGAGRSGATFQVFTVRGHRYVIPRDAARLVGEGRVDRRLFDVTRLVAWRYDDAHRDTVPVIVENARGVRSARITGLAGRRSLPSLGLDAGAVPKKDAASVWRAMASPKGRGLASGGVAKLWLDGKRTARLDKSVPRIGAPEAWRQGLTGKGVTVAVLDSGYDAGHPDLKGVVTRSRGFTDAGPQDVTDRLGHGTHVASTIAGSGEGSGGRYKGVAPDARLAVGKVLDDEGSGSDSGILAGMEWAATEVRAKVINLSLGAPDEDGVDPVEKAVNDLSARTGTLFAIASGNSGPGARTLNSPGTADAALTVGAVDGDDHVAAFSGRGPRRMDGAVKPDVTAPGVDITAAWAGGGHATASGTSMATPHVAGAAAILAQRHPTWTGGRLKAALIGSAAPASGTPAVHQGSGRIDVARAVATGVVPESGNVSTYLRWSERPAPVTRELGYFNATDRPVTLKLELQTDQPAGRDVFGLATTSLTVPPGESAAAGLRVTGEGVPPGVYSGVVTATAPGVSVRTVVGAFAEPRSHDLDLRLTDAAGRPVSDLFWFMPADLSSEPEAVMVRDGAARVRLPDGEYRLMGSVPADAGGGECGAMMAFHPVRLDRETTVHLDARRATRMSATIDDPAAELGDYRDFALAYHRGGASTGYTVLADCSPDKFGLFPVRDPGLTYYNHLFWTKQGAAGTPPIRFDAYDLRHGGLPADPAYAARTADMAEVTQTVKAQGRPTIGHFTLMADMPGISPVVAPVWPVNAPSTQTLYVTSDPRFRWWTSFYYDEGEPGYITGDARTWVKGRANTDTWNTAVIGPSVTGVFNQVRTPFGSRDGDEIAVMGRALYGDSTPGRAGWDDRATGTIELLRGGKVLKTVPLSEGELSANVPAGPGDYTVTASGTRKDSDSPLSTRVDAAWRFASTTTHKPTPLPLRSVRFTPRGLDDLNRARGGSATTLPISVDAVPGTGPVTVESLKVWASTDDGRTWKPLTLRAKGRGWVTRVANPAQGFVSLKASMTDRAGNAVDQTIIRAYAIS